MKKKLIDSIEHFDRFDTDKYVEVVNAKNGVERTQIERETGSGCVGLTLALIGVVTIATIIYIICFLRGL